jgi:hypothetical protein
VGVAPYAGTDLMIYETLKAALSQQLTDKGQEPGVLLMLACGVESFASSNAHQIVGGLI